MDLPVRSKRRSRVKEFNLQEVFWNISLNTPTSVSYTEEVHNLPSWDSPDIFLDIDDVESINTSDDNDSMYNYFSTSISIFKERETLNIHDTNSDKGVELWNNFPKIGVTWNLDEHTNTETTLKRKWNSNELLSIVNNLEDANIDKEVFVDNYATTQDEDHYDADIAQWSLENQSSFSWEKYYEIYEKPMEDRNVVWTKEKISETIGKLRTFDIERKLFFSDIVCFEEPEDIFEQFLVLFDEKSGEDLNWNEQHKFGNQWSHIILESPDQEWNNGHKFGTLWTDLISEMEEHCRLQLKKQTKKRRRKVDFDICEIFWQISLETQRESLKVELRNLPPWESPDALLDRENEKIIQVVPFNADYVNYFEDSLFIFTEPRSFNKMEIRNLKLTKRIRSSFRNSFSKLKLHSPAKQETTQKKSLPKTFFTKYISHIFKRK